MIQVSFNIDDPQERKVVKTCIDALEVCATNEDVTLVTPIVDEESKPEVEIHQQSNEKREQAQEIIKQDDPIPSQGSLPPINNNETLYFKIENGNQLVLTNSNDALCQAIPSSNKNKYMFQFNNEKGPCKEACRNKESMIMPFCVIIDEDEEATNIVPDEWGEGTYDSDRNQLKVEKKAQVKLVK